MNKKIFNFLLLLLSMQQIKTINSETVARNKIKKVLKQYESIVKKNTPKSNLQAAKLIKKLHQDIDKKAIPEETKNEFRNIIKKKQKESLSNQLQNQNLFKAPTYHQQQLKIPTIIEINNALDAVIADLANIMTDIIKKNSIKNDDKQNKINQLNDSLENLNNTFIQINNPDAFVEIAYYYQEPIEFMYFLLGNLQSITTQILRFKNNILDNNNLNFENRTIKGDKLQLIEKIKPELITIKKIYESLLDKQNTTINQKTTNTLEKLIKLVNPKNSLSLYALNFQMQDALSIGSITNIFSKLRGSAPKFKTYKEPKPPVSPQKPATEPVNQPSEKPEPQKPTKQPKAPTDPKSQKTKSTTRTNFKEIDEQLNNILIHFSLFITDDKTPFTTYENNIKKEFITIYNNIKKQFNHNINNIHSQLNSNNKKIADQLRLIKDERSRYIKFLEEHLNDNNISDLDKRNFIIHKTVILFFMQLNKLFNGITNKMNLLSKEHKKEIKQIIKDLNQRINKDNKILKTYLNLSIGTFNSMIKVYIKQQLKK